MLCDVFGSGFKLAWIAQLEADGVGLELFEFVEPSSDRTVPASYFHEGFSHVCFTVPEIDSMVTRISESGGKIRSEVWRPGRQHPHRFVHFEDPYGNLLELHSHPNRQMVNDLAAD
jgi:catechol 2,3-dioxygenase-like lactoylglutathione lyase family enzyme